jgi:tetratricopeptide (TPR) repeat protein
MLADQYDLPLSTASHAARDAYVRGLDRLLTQYDGIGAAFDAAIAADPGFALAHAGRAQALMLLGEMAGAREAIASAEALAGGVTAREASQIAFYRTLLGGRIEDSIAALEAHLAEWPRDAMVLNTNANPNGLLGSSGQVGQKARLAAMMDRLAPHYGEDWWFASAHAMALNETGQHHAARGRIEASFARRPDSAWVAHSRAHLCYEQGETDAARAFLRDWLKAYPRGGVLHGHLHWHLALGELEAGETAAAQALYRAGFSLEGGSGTARQKLQDASSFLWRWELAGHARDEAAWLALRDFARTHFPRAGIAFADLHVMLAEALAGDAVALEARIAQMAALECQGRYPSGPVVPAISRAFLAYRQRDFPAVIATLEPLLAQSERIGGSRAQTDLVEFTLLRACTEAGRAEDARRILAARRAGPGAVPVAGVAPHHA